MRRFIHVVTILAAVFSAAASLQAQTTKYWDINGTTPGGGPDGSGFYDGTWDTNTPNWNTDPTGVAPTTTWTAGENAIFVAGTAPTADGIITVSGTQTVGSFE